jgi:putative YphP/YqiW family bacilliredoxin
MSNKDYFIRQNFRNLYKNQCSNKDLSNVNLHSKNLKLKYMYPEEIVFPMKEELIENGFADLVTGNEVENALHQPGTTLFVINSVCGCSAGSARPGVLHAVVNSGKKPDHLATSFAGFDYDAVNKIREHLLPYPPSSPSIALFKDGKLVHFLERHNIEGATASMISNNLSAAFEAYC